MWVETSKNQCEQFDWFSFAAVLTTNKEYLWFNSGHFQQITVSLAEGAGIYSRDARPQFRLRIPKRPLTFTELHDVISLKRELFIITVVRTSNPV
jgi:hypothetical protein